VPEIALHFTTIIKVNGRDAVALIDSGAMGDMLSSLFASLANIAPDHNSSPMAVTIADGSSHTCAGTAMSVSVRMGKLGRTMK
jgi:predicted aspartyl protease